MNRFYAVAVCCYGRNAASSLHTLASEVLLLTTDDLDENHTHHRCNATNRLSTNANSFLRGCLDSLEARGR